VIHPARLVGREFCSHHHRNEFAWLQTCFGPVDTDAMAEHEVAAEEAG
jgi:hypothetical protein